MKKIAKFLAQYDKSRKESVTTDSLYFVYKGHQIRVSDHPGTKRVDIDIISAFNSAGTYIIYLGGNKFPLVMEYKELTSFIEHYFLLVDLSKAINKVADTPDNRRHIDDEDRTSSEKWPFIYKYLKKDIPGYEDLSAKKKQAIKQIFTTKYQYVDIVFAIRGILQTYPLTISADNFKNAVTSKLAGINFHIKP